MSSIYNIKLLIQYVIFLYISINNFIMYNISCFSCYSRLLYKNWSNFYANFSHSYYLISYIINLTDYERRIIVHTINTIRSTSGSPAIVCSEFTEDLRQPFLAKRLRICSQFPPSWNSGTVAHAPRGPTCEGITSASRQQRQRFFFLFFNMIF